MKERESLIKTLIALIILNLILFSVCAFFFFLIKSTNEKAFALEGEFSKISKQDMELKFIDENLDETEEQRQKINSYFVKRGNAGVAEFMENIERIAKSSGVALDVNGLFLNDQNANKETGKKVSEIKLVLKTEGDWSNTVYFLKLLKMSPYSVSFDRVSFEKDTDKDSKSWSGTFGIKVLKLEF
ncbi:hypothetical protein A3E89_00785 [Candidatus Campbellbacteria bacterium RIFCSPHIGHO2_12_FULL_35_10]|uniref:Uncharacterized protein n=1 Tax=Candidatus Campbellbacteria bacterium RIFCSPHIGHO2_12_FULL_35_10 TaxID=1797578 RepID=A0A1F5ELJ5_9BACT|nr:MAG: hypothetical protein A3E89_00785 [Candidatus Campbellbacteria bacterium RIFCSPHIGHO2_12_FULL_35_10]